MILWVTSSDAKLDDDVGKCVNMNVCGLITVVWTDVSGGYRHDCTYACLQNSLLHPEVSILRHTTDGCLCAHRQYMRYVHKTFPCRMRALSWRWDRLVFDFPWSSGVMSFVPFDRGWRTRTVQYGANINENYNSLQFLMDFFARLVRVMARMDAFRPEEGLVTLNQQRLICCMFQRRCRGCYTKAGVSCTTRM